MAQRPLAVFPALTAPAAGAVAALMSFMAVVPEVPTFLAPARVRVILA
jgi:hypothetical protein